MDPVLRVYGVFVSLVLTLTAIRLLTADAAAVLGTVTDAICWPFFDDCRPLRILGPGAITATLWGLGLGGLAAARLFLEARTVPAAWWTLLALNVVKHGLILLDYRMRLNQHLMAGWVTLAFLLLPAKRATLKLLLVLFYVWAGVLKFTPEWLSGAALYVKPFGIEGPLLRASTAYVLLLELVVVWGLLSARRRVGWAVFAQLVVFHLLSFPVVGFYYPLLMLLLLALFPLEWRRPDAPAEAPAPRWPKEALVVAAVFSLIQAYPRFIPGDTALTGEGRLLTLHMFDALPTCEVNATLKLKSGRVAQKDLFLPLPPRIRCDPVVYLSEARRLCRAHGKSDRFVDLDLTLRSRRSTDGDLHTIVDVTDFCAKSPGYSILGFNDWIRRE